MSAVQQSVVSKSASSQSSCPAGRGGAQTLPAHTPDQPSSFTQRKLAMLLVDLAGYAKTVRSRGDLETAAFLDIYYRLCHGVIARHGGRIVKFMGDACMAAFEPEHCAQAVGCAQALRREIDALCKKDGGAMSCGGINLHMTLVVEGRFGADHVSRPDIIGAGVNHLFLMGGGQGTRISEPVYRALPSNARSPWNKNKPPALYTLKE